MSLDVQAYVGRWYEVARKNAWFETSCYGVTADYAPTETGITLVNSCYRYDGTGPSYSESIPDLRFSSALAGKADAIGPYQLAITFESGQTGTYTVLETNYTGYSIVGDTRTGYISILSRTPTITPAERSRLAIRAAQLGFRGLEYLPRMR